MQIRNLVWKAALPVVLASFLAPTGAVAHETQGMQHSHAFQQKSYGKYRQGHYVNGPQGSIIIWSPRTVTGYQAQPPVAFARPEPMTQAPGSPIRENRAESGPVIHYGKPGSR
jgi:hypothetical protein